MKYSLNLTCNHINCSHFLKYYSYPISMHLLLLMNAMLDFICMDFAEL